MKFSRVFLALFFIGFAIIIVGMLLMIFAAASSSGQASVGGFILIGPFPIVFGAGPGAQWLVLFAIILGVISVAVIYLMARKRL
ncbi:DUF131 domain-containing protein [Candidatus Bathyarchaeota archaeon]|nr:DUF131 domain-containing protein [Candidatus Bathyarchaeota archaeon]